MPPGRVYSYSNYNTALAGLVIEARSGLTFDRYLDDHVFGPLKMTSSTVHQPPQPELAPLCRARLSLDRRSSRSQWTTATSTRARRARFRPPPATWGASCWRCSAMGRRGARQCLTPASANCAAGGTVHARSPDTGRGLWVRTPDVARAPAGLSRRHARRSARHADPRARGSPGHLHRLELATGPRRLSLRADDDAPLRRRRSAAARAGAAARRAASAPPGWPAPIATTTTPATTCRACAR